MDVKQFGKLPDMVLQHIFDYAFSGPYTLSFDIKSEKFIKKINPYFTKLNRVYKYKIDHLPVMKTDYDLDNWEKTVALYFTLPLKTPYDYRIGLENEYLKITYIFTVNLNTMIPYHCYIIIPYYYHFITKKYINMHNSLYPTTVRNFYLYKGLEKKNYGYDISIA
jgi:hypothetical protein